MRATGHMCFVFLVSMCAHSDIGGNVTKISFGLGFLFIYIATDAMISTCFLGSRTGSCARTMADGGITRGSMI